MSVINRVNQRTDVAGCKTGVARMLQEAASLRSHIANNYIEVIAKIVEVIIDCLRNNGRIFIFGNGGSAADAQHFAAEFVGRYKRDRIALPALALTTDTSILTAIANDYGYDQVFSRQLEALAQAGDVAIALSTSGKSPNVLRAIESARCLGVRTIGLSGASGLAARVDWQIAIPSSETPRIQEMHMVILHLICELVEPAFEFGDKFRHTASERKIIGWDQMLKTRCALKESGRQAVWATGFFRRLDVEDFERLQTDKQAGHVLLIGVKASEVFAGSKPEINIAPLEARMKFLAELECIDLVTALNGMSLECALAALQPDFYWTQSEQCDRQGQEIR